MYRNLGDIGLKTGEKLAAGVVRGPDREWHDRITEFLSHKGQPWNWQISLFLSENIPLKANFYLAHRHGEIVSNILTCESRGTGILAHVFTKPSERRQGAMRGLMGRQMDDFRDRGGRALFLGTGYDSHAFHLYRRFGFRPVEPESGRMAYYSTNKADFENRWFSGGPIEVAPLGWADWAPSSALYLSDAPDVVRCASLRLWGRDLTECALTHYFKEEAERESEENAPRARVARRQTTGAVVGMSAWDRHPLWPETCILDVFCHPSARKSGPDLLSALSPPETARRVTYIDRAPSPRSELFEAAGYRRTASLPERVRPSAARSDRVDVGVWEKT